MNFAESIKPIHTSDVKLTENGAIAYNTLHSPLVELFAQIGSLRARSDYEIQTKFSTAFAAHPLLATKMMFYAGNVRGGLGERRTFRICLRWLAKNFPAIVVKNIELIPEFNRYDSLFELVDTGAEDTMWSFIRHTLAKDSEAYIQNQMNVIASKKYQPLSLLAKWMPSEKASSKKTRALAFKAMKALDLSAREYRKLITTLRKEIGVIEQLMSDGKWDKINYEAVPSYAMKNYRKAFDRHDASRFKDYTLGLIKGETKVNASTLYPYNLVHEYYERGYKVDPIIEAQWKALPNYVSGENNILIMADVSGSMSCSNGRPMETSIGLATYFAQHNQGAYRGLYMTFTNQPYFINISDYATLFECYRKVIHTGVGYSTNLDKAFERILLHAIENDVKANEMPTALVVISDMEIDPYFRPDRSWDFVEKWKREFQMCGYKLPKLVMWNVEARNDTFLSQNDDIILCSGQSPSVFKNLCGALDGKTAWDFMMEVLGDKMYDCVRV